METLTEPVPAPDASRYKQFVCNQAVYVTHYFSILFLNIYIFLIYYFFENFFHFYILKRILRKNLYKLINTSDRRNNARHRSVELTNYFLRWTLSNRFEYETGTKRHWFDFGLDSLQDEISVKNRSDSGEEREIYRFLRTMSFFFLKKRTNYRWRVQQKKYYPSYHFSVHIESCRYVSTRLFGPRVIGV